MGQRVAAAAPGDAAEGGAAHQQAAHFAHLVGQGLQLLGREGLGGDVEEVALAGMAVLPPVRFRRGVGEAFQFAQGFGELGGVVVGVDHRVAPAVFDDQRRGQAVVTEAAAALPVHGLGDAAGVLAVDDFLQARDDVGVAVLAQLHHDPAAPHLVCHGAGGAGAGEGV